MTVAVSGRSEKLQKSKRALKEPQSNSCWGDQLTNGLLMLCMLH